MYRFNVFQDGPSESVVSCEGLYLNLQSGERLLDVSAGDTSHMILGWSFKPAIDAMQKQLNNFAHIDYKAWNDSNIDTLSQILVSNNLFDAVYYCGNSGAEACEASMKMSFLVHQALGNKKKIKVIGRKQSYHGSSSDAMSLTDRPNLLIHSPIFPNNKLFVSEHNYFRQAKSGETPQEYLHRCLDEIEKCILDNDPDTIASFIGETIMGGLVGDVTPVEGYWQGVRELCNKYDIHLILDEVYCGTGVSGKYHCFEYDNVIPDFLLISKTLAAGYAPLSAILTHDRYKKLIYHIGKGRLAHSTTMQGYSLGVAAAIEVQKKVSSIEFLNNVKDKGQYFRKILQDELSSSTYFKNVRGRGLRFSLENNCQPEFQEQFNKTICHEMRALGVNINSKWHRTSFTPSLLISKSEIDFVAEAFISVFKRLSGKFE